MAITKEKNIDNSMLKKLNWLKEDKVEPEKVRNNTGEGMMLVGVDTGTHYKTLPNGALLRIVTAKSMNNVKVIKGVRFTDMSKFVKINKLNNYDLLKMVKEKKINLQAYGLVCAMSCHLDRTGDNVVKIKGKKASFKQIANIVGYSSRQAETLINHLKSEGIVATTDNGRQKFVTINPIYFNRGVVTLQTIGEFYNESNLPIQFKKILVFGE